MRFYIVDAFTDKTFGGNTAGVVLLENRDYFPDNYIMQNIAKELRYSETAFITQNSETEFSTRYFTPEGEVDLCGHATIASFYVLNQENIIKDNATYINHAKAGDLKVKIEDEIFMQMAEPKDLGTIDDNVLLDDLYSIMGYDNSLKRITFLPKIISTGLPDILLPVDNVLSLNNLKPDMKALSLLSEKMNVVGVHAFSMDSDSNYTAKVRNFAPRYGIDEESATGTANAGLTYWLYLNNIINENEKCLFLQGETMGRTSEIRTELNIVNNKCNIWVGGKSRIVAKGELFL